MVTRLDAKGISLNNYNWDDGSDHDGVSKIYIRGGMGEIEYIYFDYVKGGKSIEGSCRGTRVSPGYNMVEINHIENEYLETVTGTYDEDVGLCSLVFKTNLKTFEPIMPREDNPPEEPKAFTLAVKGKKIIGFHGSDDTIVYSLGAYFTWITPTKVEAKGGKGGKEWDDGYEQEDVSMIHVQGGYGGIQSIQFDYVSNRRLKKGLRRGVSSGGYPATYEINYLEDEYLVYVEGYYDEGSRAIQGIQFTTNTRTFPMAGYANGRKFTLASNGNKINGFHGYADKRGLISIGAYFTTTYGKLECFGDDKRGPTWDDGGGYDGIRKVFVDTSRFINYIRFEYVNRGKVIKTHRRREVEYEEEFVINYPDEFITSVEGSLYDGAFGSLTIKTSKGRTSPTYGELKGSKFVLEKPGHILVGFHGRADYKLLALGAYYRPLTPLPDMEKLEAEGGDGGDYWDDGNSFNRIAKIYIGLTENAIGFVKFMYVRNDRIALGDDHGNKTLLSHLQEFTLSDPAEYLTSVEGEYDDKSGVITMLRFITNNNSSGTVFGFGTTSSFTLHKDEHKIVGFHGQSSNMLHQIGVHVLPIS